MENVLENLTESLQSALGFLQGDGKAELIRELHDHSLLPSQRFEKIVSPTIDLLHKVEQLLEPGPLVLADHFLGMHLRNISCTRPVSNEKISQVMSAQNV